MSNCKKITKNLQKAVDKSEKGWYYSQAVARKCRDSAPQIRRFRDSEMAVDQTGKTYLTHFAVRSARTLKIKQCKTERKHTQYPLILTQYEKNPETRNCFQIKTPKSVMSYKLKND